MSANMGDSEPYSNSLQNATSSKYIIHITPELVKVPSISLAWVELS